MAGEALEPTPVEEGTAIPSASDRKKRFSPFLRMGAALRKGSVEPRPVVRSDPVLMYSLIFGVRVRRCGR